MSFTDPLWLVFLATGFAVGFGHCIGMCGPMVVSLSLSLGKRSAFLSHILYNTGRICTYTLMGGIMGMSGSFTVIAHRMVVIQKGVMIFAGLVIIVMGLGMSGVIGRGHIFKSAYQPGGIIAHGYQKFTASKSTRTYFPLGLILGLLPCGPVYTALIACAGAGMEAQNYFQGFMDGAVLMISFGAGTAPALLLVGKLSDMGWLKYRQIIYKAGAVLMIGVGIYFVVKGIRY